MIKGGTDQLIKMKKRMEKVKNISKFLCRMKNRGRFLKTAQETRAAEHLVCLASYLPVNVRCLSTTLTRHQANIGSASVCLLGQPVRYYDFWIACRTMSLMGSLCLYHSLLGDTLSQMQAIAHCMVSNARHSANVVLMLGQRRRRCPNINTTLDHHLVFDPL